MGGAKITLAERKRNQNIKKEAGYSDGPFLRRRKGHGRPQGRPGRTTAALAIPIFLLLLLLKVNVLRRSRVDHEARRVQNARPSRRWESPLIDSELSAETAVELKS